MDLIQSLRKLSSRSHQKDYTHVSIFPNSGSYYLEPIELNAFMNEYCNRIAKHDEIGIGERIINACPIFTDIDLCSLPNEYEEPIDLYTDDDLKCIIRIYFKMLDRLFPNIDPKEYTCIVLEKSPYMDKDKGIVKHGFHLQFPYLCLSVENHKNHIIPEVRKLVNDYFRADVFDANVINTPWLLYGSKKSKDKEPYLVTRIYSNEYELIDPEDFIRDFPLVDCVGERIVPDKPAEFYYPFALSMNCQFREIKDIHIDVMESSLVRQITTPEFHTDKPQFQIRPEDWSINFKKAQKLVAMLDDSRASDYSDWMRVGWALFNACGPSEEVLELWMEFSKRTTRNNYSRQKCLDAWKNMQAGSLTLGTLCWMAAEDSPEKYTAFTYEERRAGIQGALCSSHFDIALLLYEDYKEVFKCTSIKDNRWYHFYGHTWHRTEVGTTLRNIISTTLLERFKQARHKEITRKRAEEDRCRELQTECNTKAIDAQIKAIDKVILNLKTNGFKTSVMRECCEIFYDDKFEESLDSNPNLFAFQNGIYDLRTHTFRCGMPSDRITLVAPIDYIESYDYYHPEVQNVLAFLNKLFPDRSLRDYFINVYSKIFVGGNREKKFYIWTGEGNNGKSILYDLFELVLGPYSQKPPTSLLTGKRTQSSQADPILSNVKGVRSWMFQETRQKDPINTGIAKELTGNDSFRARDLFQKGSDMHEIKPMFKVGLMCNELPTIFDADKAMWNRVRIIPFESCFVDIDELPETEDEQLAQKKFLIDYEFSEKLPEMAQPFAWFLLNELKKNGGHIGTEPFKVRSATEAYRTENNLIEQFLEENIEKRVEGVLTLQELYNAFTEWCKNTNITDKSNILAQRSFKKKLIKEIGEPKQGRWFGYAFLQDDFVEEEDRMLEQ